MSRAPPPPQSSSSPPPAIPQTEARLAMMEIANMISVPMALTAVIRMNVPSTIWSNGANSPLSAAELLPPNYPEPSVLERLLRLLASHNIFADHGGTPRRFSLTTIGQTLVPSSSSSASYADFVLQHHQDALLRAWPRLHEAISDPFGPEAFARAHDGVPAYVYYGRDEEANKIMQRAMAGVSEPFMAVFLDGYGEDGFDGVRRLVDVGGSSGACLEMIMRRVKSIEEGVNFDLPGVVAAAAPIAGVRHVGGDMLESIPAGDAIFMKWVLITCTNDECTKILKNCYDALPEGGKVIACEPVVPEVTDTSRRTRALLSHDIFVMVTYKTMGRERSEDEFRQLCVCAGFTTFRAIYLDPFYAVFEFMK